MAIEKLKLKNPFTNFCFLFVFLFIIEVSAFAQSNVIELNYNFRSGSLGWTAGFADYPPNIGTGYDLAAGLRFMPRKLTRLPQRGFYIQGNNHSDDLFMFLKRRLGVEDGIVAGVTYRVEYVIMLASNAPSGCFGIGGAPGESVYLKAGASSIEPLAILQSDGWLRMNVDKGSQSQGGAAASVLGNIGNGISCAQAAPRYPFALIQRSHPNTTNAAASSNGELWLLVGTDSGFEGTTRLYYQSIQVRLVPV